MGPWGSAWYLYYISTCTQLNVRQSNLAQYVEDRIPRADLIAFVCRDKDDVNTLKHLMDQQGWAVNIVHSNSESMQEFQPKIPEESIRYESSRGIGAITWCTVWVNRFIAQTKAYHGNSWRDLKQDINCNLKYIINLYFFQYFSRICRFWIVSFLLFNKTNLTKNRRSI